MSKIFQLEGGQYEHPNEYKLVSTVRGTTILQPEFGTVIIEGDVIEASTHNTIQKNGVLASKVNVTMESTDTVLVPTDMTIESDLFNELKIMLLFETGTTLPSNSFIKLKETNVPIANVNEYIVNANTPLLFLYFDSKFYAYKAGEGASTVKIATTAQVSAGTDNTTAVSPAKLREVFANSKVKNGYQKLANGTIIQWGAAVYTPPGNSVGSISSITNNFPITFPNKVLSIVLTGFFDTGVTGDDGLECLHSVEGSSNSAFTFRATRLVGSTLPGQQGSAYYIAIGY